MTCEQFKSDNRLEDVLRHGGLILSGSGPQFSAKCPFHEDRTASLSVNTAKQVWHCHAGCGGGSVIDWIARRDGITPEAVIRTNGLMPPKTNGHPAEPATFQTVAVYDYTDQLGELLYQVVRQHAPDPAKAKPYLKTFKQRQPAANGDWKWSMDGAMRVLYRLPEVVKAETVWIVEGEKDANNLAELGLCATCNVGGAGKWLDSYNDSLAGKDIIICGDNDKVGQDHTKEVFESVAGKCRSVKLVYVPKPSKDVSEMIALMDKPTAVMALNLLADSAVPHTKGIKLPIYQLHELEARYSKIITASETSSLDLGKWIPSLGRQVRRLLPGEVAVIVAETGVGKTAVCQNLAMKAAPLMTLLFELELPGELMFERFVAIQTKLTCQQIEDAYRSGDMLGKAALMKHFAHIYVCAESRISLTEMEGYINHAELKMGERPKLVIVDYMGLVQSQGRSRYERISHIAEELKVIAKSTRTILVCAVQISRPDQAGEAPGLHDAKDSGSIENSAGLVLGLWRDSDDHTLLYMKVLKNTKGRPCKEIPCNFDGARMIITERSPLSEADADAARQTLKDP